MASMDNQHFQMKPDNLWQYLAIKKVQLTTINDFIEEPTLWFHNLLVRCVIVH